MENEMNESVMPSYWTSVLIGALVVALLTSIVGTVLLYYMAGADPSPGMLILLSAFFPITCLLGLVGGIISTRHYAKTFDITFPIGKGAVIGLLTGVIAALIAGVIGQLWSFIDPALVDNLIANITESFESVNMPEEQKEESLSGIIESFESSRTLGGALQGTAINAGVLGVVNLISGMIGAKIFAKEEE